MASNQRPRLSATTPVVMQWGLSQTGADVPMINVAEDEPLRETIFAAHDVDSLQALSDSIPNGVRESRNELQFGFAVGPSRSEYATGVEALATVEGIDDELAANLIGHYRDVQTMCKRIREDRHLHALRGDAEMDADEGESVEWVDDLERDGLERRMKEANVWVEPDDASAGGW